MAVERVDRPPGFRDFLVCHRFHAIYLLNAPGHNAIKIGIADDPFKRFPGIQGENFIDLEISKFWWMAGRPLTQRVETAFKNHYVDRNIRGEWYRDLPLDEAAAFVEARMAEINSWVKTDEQMLGLFEDWRALRREMDPEDFA